MVVTCQDSIVGIVQVREILDCLHHCASVIPLWRVRMIILPCPWSYPVPLPIPRVPVVGLVHASLPLVLIQVLGYLGRAYTLWLSGPSKPLKGPITCLLLIPLCVVCIFKILWMIEIKKTYVNCDQGVVRDLAYGWNSPPILCLIREQHMGVVPERCHSIRED